MKMSLLQKGYCPRQSLFEEAVRRQDNWPLVMLGERIDHMVCPSFYHDNGVTARLLWSSHVGKDVVTALAATEASKEIHIFLCDSPEEVEGNLKFKSAYYTVGLTVTSTVKMMVYAADLWTPYEALIR